MVRNALRSPLSCTSMARPLHGSAAKWLNFRYFLFWPQTCCCKGMNSRRCIRCLSLALLLLCPALARTEGLQVIPLDPVASGTFYLKALLDQAVEADMLLDTGSGYVSLSPATFARIKDDPGTVFLRHIEGVMADGKRQRVPVYRIAELQLGEACVLHEVEVAVLRGASRDILGLSALRRLQPLTLQLDPPVLTATCG